MDKTEVKNWLKSIGKNREWLAEQCGTARRTINTWLSTSRPIPKRAQVVISGLIVQYPAGEVPQIPVDENSLTLSVDAETFDAWNASAARENKLLRQWAIDALTDHANQTEEGE